MHDVTIVLLKWTVILEHHIQLSERVCFCSFRAYYSLWSGRRCGYNLRQPQRGSVMHISHFDSRCVAYFLSC